MRKTQYKIHEESRRRKNRKAGAGSVIDQKKNQWPLGRLLLETTACWKESAILDPNWSALEQASLRGRPARCPRGFFAKIAMIDL
jgi:hypothetical protein